MRIKILRRSKILLEFEEVKVDLKPFEWDDVGAHSVYPLPTALEKAITNQNTAIIELLIKRSELMKGVPYNTYEDVRQFVHQKTRSNLWFGSGT